VTGPRDPKINVGLALAVTGTVVAGFLVFAHVSRVHDQTREWAWTPSAASPMITYEGRHYLKQGASKGLAADYVRLGRTGGGGEIFGPDLPPRSRQVGLQVRADSLVYDYTLSGGP
jgi:hypothetical protein